jgi:hypothetical protein
MVEKAETARQRFKVGSKVRLSATGLAALGNPKIRTGIVVGFGFKDPTMVRVRCSRQVSVRRYSMIHWEVVK